MNSGENFRFAASVAVRSTLLSSLSSPLSAGCTNPRPPVISSCCPCFHASNHAGCGPGAEAVADSLAMARRGPYDLHLHPTVPRYWVRQETARELVVYRKLPRDQFRMAREHNDDGTLVVH